MSTAGMASQPYGRHRLAVLPGLSGSKSPSAFGDKEFGTTMATLDEHTSNKQLVPLSAVHSKQRIPQIWNGSNSLEGLRSRQSDENLIQNVVSRVATLEEANKALLEEMYRLQSNARAADFGKKEAVKEEKKVQRDLMETMRSSNDLISQLTSRLRRAEEKLHREKENVQNLTNHSKKLEQVLLNVQKENDSTRDTQMTQVSELRHRIDDVTRKWERSDRTSENIVDEFHQLKSRMEMQGMEFSHLQTEIKQRSKRIEDEMKQAVQQARLQKDTNNLTEQGNLQLRHLLESRLAETRDSLVEIRNRVAQSETDGRSQVQQLALKLSEQQSAINDLTHRRQEEMQSLEKSRQEHDHSEAGERLKLQNKIQAAVEEMSDKLLKKEVRLREEAVKKFIDVEKLLQREESARIEFEKQIRDETESRWNMQQKIYMEEMQAMKEMRRTERSKQTATQRRVEEDFHNLERKLAHERKALEKVLLAEITKREEQSSRVLSQLEGVQDQLRVAISSLQQAIGGMQLQAGKDKQKMLSDAKQRFSEAETKFSRAVADMDVRLGALTVRLTQQEETVDSKITEFQSSVRDQHNEFVHSAAEWRETMNKDVSIIQDALKELPQELRETQERLDLLKNDYETRNTLDSETRLKEGDAVKSQMQKMVQRIDANDVATIEERNRTEKVHRELIASQGKLAQVERFLNDARSTLTIRLNSETKMRLEETSSIKRDLARLKVDIEPLLWQQNTRTRQFVKKPSSVLNEWGIYQCARWFDIKMRWLRLLDRRRSREAKTKTPERSFVSQATPKSQSPLSLSAKGPGTPESPQVVDLERRSALSERQRESVTESRRGYGGMADSEEDDEDERVLESPDAPSDVEELSEEDERPVESNTQPQPAWYNQQHPGVDEDGSDAGVGADEDSIHGNNAVETPQSGRQRENSQRSQGGTPQQTPRESAGTRRSPAGGEKKSPTPSTRTPPGGSQGSGKGASSQRKRGAFGSTSGAGTAYDMEGRKN